MTTLGILPAGWQTIIDPFTTTTIDLCADCASQVRDSWDQLLHPAGQDPLPGQLGDYLRLLRARCQMTQSQVAVAARIALATYASIEQGHSVPRLKTLHGIARALDVPAPTLISWKPHLRA